MKSLNEYIKESIKVNNGSQFKEEVSYSIEDWNKWKEETDNVSDITVYEDTEHGLFTVYMNNKHIATYLVADEKLLCDDTKLFGN
mgnify:CR=1 FL=1